MDLFCRTEMLIGSEGLKKLQRSSVAIFGIGGVGSYVIEALARSGLGNIALIDHDIISISNINRQLIANINTINKKKIDIMEERLKDINPAIEVETFDLFYNDKTRSSIDLSRYDYLVDAIDTVSSKLLLISEAKKYKIDIISCMGTANKIDPTLFEIDDIYRTSVCPLAKIIRKELRKKEIKNLKVLYSKETPIKPQTLYNYCEEEKTKLASIAFVPSVAGLIIAGEVIKDIINKD